MDDDFFCILPCEHEYVYYYSTSSGEVERCIRCGHIRFVSKIPIPILDKKSYEKYQKKLKETKTNK
jgi:hypothetical protein